MRYGFSRGFAYGMGGACVEVCGACVEVCGDRLELGLNF